MKILATNKKAYFDYEILEKYEAGIVLSGQEVKSAKSGHISLKGSFVTIKNNELFLTNAIISRYKFSGSEKTYDQTQSRKLLVKRSEIKALIGKYQSRGLTLVPLKVYTKDRLVKVEFALAKGKKAFDKRHSIAKNEAERKIKRALKNF